MRLTKSPLGIAVSTALGLTLSTLFNGLNVNNVWAQAATTDNTLVTTPVTGLARQSTPLTQPQPQPQQPQINRNKSNKKTNSNSSNKAVNTLIEQLKLWEARYRPDMTKEVLDKLFAVDPDHVYGLEVFARYSLQFGNPQEALWALEKIRISDPHNPAVQRLRDLLRLETGDKPALQQARILALGGRLKEAIAAFEKLFQGEPPSPDLAREYWQLVYRTADGKQQARSALIRLAKANPENIRFRLAMLEVAVSEPPFELKLIDELESLAKNPTISLDARRIWRKAIDNIEQPAQSVVYMKKYLQFNPADIDVFRQLDNVQSKLTSEYNLVNSPSYKLKLQGLAALEKNDAVNAERYFRQSLKGLPNDPQVVGGLGYVRLRQGRHQDATAYFRRAMYLDPDNGQWQSLIDTARFWQLIGQAEQQIDDGQYHQATTTIEQAQRLDPQSPQLPVTQGHMAQAQQDYRQAHSLYRQALRVDPTNGGALRGILDLYKQQSQKQRAFTFIDSLNTEQREVLISYLPGLRAHFLQQDAALLTNPNDQKLALSTLEQALVLAPTDPWLRYDIAKRAAALGDENKGIRLYEQVMGGHTRNPDMLFSYALFLSSIDREDQALDTLAAIPMKQRSPSIISLTERLTLNRLLKQAEQAADKATVLKLMDQAQHYVTANPALMLDVINTWQRLGYPDQALRTMEVYLAHLARQKQPVDMQTRLDYIALLIDNNRRIDALVQLAYATADNDITDVQRLTVADIYVDLHQPIPVTNSANPAANVSNGTVTNRVTVNTDGNGVVVSTLGNDTTTVRDLPAVDLKENVGVASPDDDPVDPGLQALQQLSRDTLGLALQTLDGVDQANLADQSVRNLLLTRLRILRLQQNRPAVMDLSEALLAQYPDERNTRLNLVELLDDSQKARRQYHLALLNKDYDQLSYRQQASLLDYMVKDGETAADQQTTNPEPDPSHSVTAQLINELLMSHPLDADLYQTAVALADQHQPPRVVNQVYQKAILTRRLSLLLADAGLSSVADLSPLVAKQQLVKQNFVTSNKEAVIDQALRLIDDIVHLPATQLRLVDDSLTVDNWQVDSLKRNMVDHWVRNNDYIEIGFDWSSKSGSQGQSQLDSLNIPIEARFHLDSGGSWFFRAEPVLLDPGKLNLNDRDESELFGTVLLCPEQGPIPPGQSCPRGLINHRQFGVSLAIGIEKDNWKADIGTVPLGFELVDFVGGYEYSGNISDYYWSAEVARRPVSSSVLSFGGGIDPNSKLPWGGVTSLGVNLGFGYDQGEAIGIWSSFGYHVLNGTHVQSNVRKRAMGGIYWRALTTDPFRLTVGANLLTWQYKQDVSEFTFGQGGYYSPQFYNSLSLPIDLFGLVNNDLSYLLRIIPSVSRAADAFNYYYPIDSGLQQQAGNITDQPFFPGDNSKTVSFGMTYQAAIEYRFAPHWTIGLNYGIQQAEFFQPSRGMIYLRYFFEPALISVFVPPKPVKLYQNF